MVKLSTVEKVSVRNTLQDFEQQGKIYSSTEDVTSLSSLCGHIAEPLKGCNDLIIHLFLMLMATAILVTYTKPCAFLQR